MGDTGILQALIHFFETDDWDFQELEAMPVLTMGFKGENGQWTCFAQAREDQEQVVFYSVAPISVPEDKRHSIAEFITRANYGMIIGNFELDYNDGEVRYKTSVDIEDATLTQEMIRQLVYSNVLIMDRYLPGFLDVMYNSITPKDAVSKIEADGNVSGNIRPLSPPTSPPPSLN